MKSGGNTLLKGCSCSQKRGDYDKAGCRGEKGGGGSACLTETNFVHVCVFFPSGVRAAKVIVAPSTPCFVTHLVDQSFLPF